MTSIPADRLVKVTPTVEPTGGTGLDVQGLFLTQSNRVPAGQVQAFQNADDVSVFFGSTSIEAATAIRYFKGFDGSPIKPANLLFAQYPPTAVPAYLRGGSLKALTLAQLRAIAGVVTITINGAPVVSGAIDLSGATSFSNAATLIAAAFNHNDAAFTASQAGNVLTVTAVSAGALAVGQIVAGAGVTVGTKITALGTGTGGAGTYTVDSSATVASEAMTAGAMTVAYDSVSSAFVLSTGTPGVNSTIAAATVSSAATALKLTTAQGAVVSQGAAAATPATAMDSVISATQDFVTFSTIFLPSDDDMVAFAAWCDAHDARFPYIQWDNNAAMTVPGDVASAAAQIRIAGYQGVESIYTVASPYKAAFVMGAIASIDFNRENGRTNVALLSQVGLPADVTDGTIADTLKANGYNYYGSFGSANAEFLLFNPGSVTGPFLWMDSLINSIWMTNNFQLAGLTLLTRNHNIPYNAEGYAIIDAYLVAAVVNPAVRFGAIRSGVPLSDTQAADINAQAGVQISDILTQRGWYLQILPASPEVRSARGSPPMTFWYTDGQSVQMLDLNTVEVQ